MSDAETKLANELAQHRREFETARESLHEFAAKAERERARIARDRDLSDDAKRERLRALERNTLQDVRALRSSAATAEEKAAELVERIRSSRLAEPSVQGRVRELLKQGVSPDDILEQAWARRDPETVVALRNELRYQAKPRRPGSGMYEKAERFAGNRSQLERADRLLAELASGSEQSAARALVDFHDARSDVDSLFRYVVQSAAGKASAVARLRHAYASQESGA